MPDELSTKVGLTTPQVDDASTVDQAIQLINEGNKIAAIRLLRTHYDVSLKVAKDAADMLAQGQNVDMEWLKMRASQTATQYVKLTPESPGSGVSNYVIWICILIVLLGMIIFLITVVR